MSSSSNEHHLVHHYLPGDHATDDDSNSSSTKKSAGHPPPLPPIEPYRIKMVEPIALPSREERQLILKQAGYNLFKVPASRVFIDLLTDSGTGAMSQEQWSALMIGDESYAMSKSMERLTKVAHEIFGIKNVFPCHQGRAAENILAACLVQPGDIIPSNTHFDTTEANMRARGGDARNFVPNYAQDPSAIAPFKGNIDVAAVEELLKKDGLLDPKDRKVRFAMITVTNNSIGGQPVSMENMRQYSALLKKYGVKLYVDAARFAENCYFIKQREPEFKNHTLLQIAQEFFSYADGFTMSAKKDAIVNIGGLLATRDDELAKKITNELILREGFVSYGGLAGRDLDCIATGLFEGLNEDYLAHRVGQTAYLIDQLKTKVGVRCVEPAGGHAVYIDAAAMLPQIPPGEFPGHALAIALYEEGGIRSCEIGSVMRADRDKESGEWTHPKQQLLRLAIPRRTYTQSHLDFVVRCVEAVKKRAASIRGLKYVYEPEVLRHFTATFEPLS